MEIGVIVEKAKFPGKDYAGRVWQSLYDIPAFGFHVVSRSAKARKCRAVIIIIGGCQYGDESKIQQFGMFGY